MWRFRNIFGSSIELEHTATASYIEPLCYHVHTNTARRKGHTETHRDSQGRDIHRLAKKQHDQRQRKTPRDTPRHTETNRDTQRHTKTHRDTQRHTETHRDAQRQRHTETHSSNSQQQQQHAASASTSNRSAAATSFETEYLQAHRHIITIHRQHHHHQHHHSWVQVAQGCRSPRGAGRLSNYQRHACLY